jgi:hypothetical protein
MYIRDRPVDIRTDSRKIRGRCPAQMKLRQDNCRAVKEEVCKEFGWSDQTFTCCLAYSRVARKFARIA